MNITGGEAGGIALRHGPQLSAKCALKSQAVKAPDVFLEVLVIAGKKLDFRLSFLYEHYKCNSQGAVEQLENLQLF